MVKFLVFVCFLLLRSFALHAQPQNLVPNPSFEEHSCCPCKSAMLNCCDYWFVKNSTPDYFNSCNNEINDCFASGVPTGVSAVPKNSVGEQSAKDGNAYIGIITSLQFNDNFSQREYIGIKLPEKLSENRMYCYSYWISLADSSNYTGKNFGIAFGDNETSNWFNENFYYLEGSNFELAMSDKWTKVEGVVYAKGWEEYLFIGNFITDSTTKIPTGINSFLSFVYVYIDLVSLIPCDSNYLPNIFNVVTPNNDGVNDTWIVEDIYSTVGSVQIFNRWGNIIYNRYNNEPIVWNPERNSEGVYFYIIQNSKNPNEQKRGTITVLGGP